jgi:hypothetical protein
MSTGTETEYNDMIVRAERFIGRSDAPTEITTAGAATYTAAQILSGFILRDPSGSARTDVLPTAALLVAAIPQPQIGDTFRCRIINTADASEAITIDAGTGGAYHAHQTAASKVIAQDASGEMIIRITGVSTPAYVCYLGV